MEATQLLEDCVLEEEAGQEEALGKEGKPLAKLRVFKNDHFPETDIPLFLGDNMLGRDPSSCSHPLPARSVSKQHAVISLTLFPGDGYRDDVIMEALLWDLGSMNGTRKGRFRLTPNVRYALGEGESVVLADLPCQYVSVGLGEAGGEVGCPVETEAERGRGRGKRGGRGRGRGSGRQARTEKESGAVNDISAAKNITGQRTEGRRSESEVSTPNVPRAKPLTLEQTPKEPELTLVPESESDSDGERGGRRERRTRMLVSHSDSPQTSGPSCSAFLTPASKIVPESDNEDSVTPSSSVNDTSEQKVSLNQTEVEEKVPNELKKKKKTPRVIVDDSDSEESVLLGGASVEKGVCEGEGRHDVSQHSKTPDLVTALIPDSDPDVEGQGEAGQKNSQHREHGSSPMNKETVKPNGTLAPAGLSKGVPILNMDSDTDVEGEEEVGNLPGSGECKAALDSGARPSPVPAVNPLEFHLDSDTDVEEDTDGVTRSGTGGTDLEETAEDPPRSGVNFSTSPPDAAVLKPQALHFDSDTDAEDGDAAVLVPKAEAPATAAGKGLEILSDSDTDAEQDAAEPCPPAAEAGSGSQPRSGSQTATVVPAARPEADSDTDMEDSGPARLQSSPKANIDPRDFNLDSDTDVEDAAEETSAERVGEAQGSPSVKGIGGLLAPGVVEPKCSTPLAPVVQEEELETQAFLCPSDPFMRPSVPPVLKAKPLEDSQGDSTEEVFVAETQCFGSDGPQSSHLRDTASDATQLCSSDSSLSEDFEDQPTQAFSFQLGLSDSSRLQVSATQSTQVVSQGEEEAEMDATQAYEEAPPPRGDSVEMDLDIMPTQAYGDNVHGMCPTVSSPHRGGGAETEEDEELDATQAYTGEVQVRTVADEEAETQPVDPHSNSHLSTADTQPVSALQMGVGVREEEEEEEGEEEQEEEEEEAKASSQKRMRRSQRGRAKEPEEVAATSRSSRSRSKRADGKEEEGDSLEPPKRQTRGKIKAEKATRGGGRRRVMPLEAEDREEEEDKGTEGKSKGVGKRKAKNMIQQRQDRDSEGTMTLEKENQEREEKERLEREEREEKERLQREREEEERLEREREEKERLEREQREREEKERLEREQREREEKERLQREREEKERLEREQREREEKERLEREREEKERLQREREEKERLEREQREREEKERLEREREETERLEKEQKEREEKERLDRERKEQEEKQRSVRERKEQEEKQREEEEMKERLENEKREREQADREGKEKETEESEKKPKPSARGRRQTRSMASTAPTIALELPELDGHSTLELIPEPGTRSRSSSITSVSSGKSSSSTGTQRRGRGRRSQRTEPEADSALLSDQKEEPPTPRSSGRGRKSQRMGVSETDVNPMQPENTEKDDPKQNNARGRNKDKKVSNSDAPAIKVNQTTVQESVETSAPKASSRGRGRGRKAGDSDSVVAEVDQTMVQSETSRAESPAPKASSRGKGRGRRVSDSDSTAAEEGQNAAVVEAQSEEMEVCKGSGRNRGQKRGLEGGAEGEEGGGSFKVPRGKSHRTAKGAREEEEEVEEELRENEDEPSPVPKRGRAPTTQGKKKEQQAEMETEEKKKEGDASSSVQRRGRGRQATEQKRKEGEEEEKREEDQEEESLSVPSSEEQNLLQTPTGRSSRKRVAASESPPTVVKTPRHSITCAPSPGTGGRHKAVAQAPKVLFTGVMDEAGEAITARLGGSMAKGVNDMTHLVTDKVRRTVKFLCAVARGVPIVTTDWLDKSGKNGGFLSPSAFLVKDVEQEKKFGFCLEESLRTANAQPLLEGYEIHVTRSVKPDPAQMKDIISCSGARYLPKMPSVAKPQTVVISCAEDAHLCGPALSASLPVLSAEFLLTGILQQRVDLDAHTLSSPELELALKGGAKGRRKK
ncbi:mediator of DNA damage checkpoint protein 1 [Megalops cyprinoides]|uniref:mediator of DNA damage checkpoint protein 1 n=1 Tax=Megalops cyprinoides TaxID=118141 RepID=UPI001864BC36|nr:mediator of DNA damage checkpoint protein 1 [Megalops cyprinoides]